MEICVQDFLSAKGAKYGNNYLVLTKEIKKKKKKNCKRIRYLVHFKKGIFTLMIISLI